MQGQPESPRIDDFRLERTGDTLVVTFTPDGRSYTFPATESRLSEPSVAPAQANAADYVEDEVRKAATELARLTLTGSPSGDGSGSAPPG
ncbi:MULTISPECIES: hypothetical protein [Microvirga]|uniref:Uncharacterized protein n=2 Tax=Microvirga TaxID=186650 RepID=A0ABW9Z2A5_9HYPH|nr:hypothetical protein [Microvirga arsenatis]NBJ13077.1 hypothetical protein [Microvirga arsenatis]NBJ26804.1 hypothetical protein [Microvirga arsenatis]